MNKLLLAGAFSTTLLIHPGLVMASDDTSGNGSMNHGSMNHGEMKHDSMNHGDMKAMDNKTEAMAVGVVNSIDEKAGKINVTHEPVPELGWPKMTMDLPVTRRVDLSSVKTGTPVNITLKQGRDKQFRVMAIEPK